MPRSPKGYTRQETGVAPQQKCSACRQTAAARARMPKTDRGEGIPEGRRYTRMFTLHKVDGMTSYLCAECQKTSDLGDLFSEQTQARLAAKKL